MDSETRPEDTASLRYLAQDCARRFAALLQIEDSQDGEVNAKNGYWVSRSSADFNMWCAKLGVNGGGIRSIDVRLKDIPETCTMLLILLNSLQRDLAATSRHYTGDHATPAEVYGVPQDLEASSDTSSLSFESLPSSEASEGKSVDDAAIIPAELLMMTIRQHISETISRLEGHARLISQAGASHRRRRVEVYRQKEGPNQVFENFRQLGRVKAKQQFPQAVACITERAAESFALRRIRFQYLQKHQEKRAVDSEYPFHGSSLSPSSLPPASGGLTVETLRGTQEKSARRADDQKTILSHTVNTIYNMPITHRRKQRAESVISTVSTGQGFPPPPLIIDGRFQCPYCLLEFREDEAEERRWRKHIMYDFEPYFCTDKDCKAPFDITNSFVGLLDHMQRHSQVVLHGSTDYGENEVPSKTSFKSRRESQAESSDEGVNLMEADSRDQGAYLFHDCPFCGGYPDVIESSHPDPETLDAQEALRKHIKHHMQQIALFFPPDRPDCHADMNHNTQISDVSVRRSNSEAIPENLEDFVSICGRPDCDCVGDRGEIRNEPTPSVSDIAKEHLKEARWTCCRCLNDYSSSGKNHCSVTGCNNHEPRNCHQCDVYERDSTHEGDWSHILGDHTAYDRSDITLEELTTDERLRPFVLRARHNADESTYSERDTESATTSRLMKSSATDIADVRDTVFPSASSQLAPTRSKKRVSVSMHKLDHPSQDDTKSSSILDTNSPTDDASSEYAVGSHQDERYYNSINTVAASSQTVRSFPGRQGANIYGSYAAALNLQQHESIDPTFQVRSSSFFQEGIVFAVLFTEAAGNTTQVYNSSISYVRYGEQVHVQIRRFIVVGARRGRGFCYACPIFTYNNKATNKPGVNPNEHAIAYSIGYSPTLLDNETQLTKRPICVVMVPGEQALTRASRICFGIHHPIQYNVKVKHIGQVKETDVPDLLGYWKMENAVFANNPAEAEVEAMGWDPDVYDAKSNPHGYDAELKPHGYHPEYNPCGYHPKKNTEGYHPKRNPHMYHPFRNVYGYHEEQNPIGYHPKKNENGFHPVNNPHMFHPVRNPYGYHKEVNPGGYHAEKNEHSFHPEHNPYGYHVERAPFCWHPRLNPQGYHSVHNLQGYHPHSNKFCYHPQENPLGYNSELNAWGYHDQHNPYGYHTVYNLQGYHPTYNPRAYHPYYHADVTQEEDPDEEDSNEEEPNEEEPNEEEHDEEEPDEEEPDEEEPDEKEPDEKEPDEEEPDEEEPDEEEPDKEESDEEEPGL